MPDLDALRDFAVSRGYNLTGPLRHADVEALANAWFPEIRFHEKERFHPVDLAALLRIPVEQLAQLPASAREAFRVGVHTATLSNGQQVVEHFDPPVVHRAAGNARQVLASGSNAAAAMHETGLDRSGVFSYGARLEAAREFFGGSTTVSGATEPVAGDPRRPRHLPIVVRAELRLLLEALKHELELDDLPPALRPAGLPIDAIWSNFRVERSFFVEDRTGGGSGGTGQPPEPFSIRDQRGILADLVAARFANDPAAELAALNRIPHGHAFVQRAWDAVTQYAFLEFYLVYAFNDYKEYGTWPFENEHEGDVEGCCVVFERSDLMALADGTKSAAEVTAHTLITSVHEEFNDNDGLKRLPLANDKARDDLVVYVAPGSHATYLTAGSHDILDFEDVFTDLPGELPTWVQVLGTMTLVLPVLALIAGIVEHFVDSEDETSDNGVSVGPGDPDPDPASLSFEKRIETTPFSDIHDDLNVYQDAFRDLRALRGFHGAWGGDTGTVSHSSAWENKTARYFRRFLESGQIRPQVVIE